MAATQSAANEHSGSELGEYRWFRMDIDVLETIKFSPSGTGSVCGGATTYVTRPIVDVVEKLTGNTKIEADVYVRFKKSPVKKVLTPTLNSPAVAIAVKKVDDRDVSPSAPVLPDIADSLAGSLSALGI